MRTNGLATTGASMGRRSQSRLSPGTSYTSSLVEYALPEGVCWRILWPLTLKTWLWLSDKCLTFKIGYCMTIKIIFFTALYIQYIYMQIHVITVLTIAIIVVKFSIIISVLLSFIYIYNILSYYIRLFILVYKVIYWCTYFLWTHPCLASDQIEHQTLGGFGSMMEPGVMRKMVDWQGIEWECNERKTHIMRRIVF